MSIHALCTTVGTNPEPAIQTWTNHGMMILSTLVFHVNVQAHKNRHIDKKKDIVKKGEKTLRRYNSANRVALQGHVHFSQQNDLGDFPKKA